MKKTVPTINEVRTGYINSFTEIISSPQYTQAAVP